MSPSRPRWLLTAIHDVSPSRLPAVADLRAWLARRGVPRITLLVVPDFHGEEPWEKHPAAAETLRSWARAGDEILLHGLHHREDPPASTGPLGARLQARFLTAGEGEFLRLGQVEAARRLDCGWRRLEALGLQPQGFVAPAWLYSQGARLALGARGPVLYEDNLALRRADGQSACSPVIGLSTRRVDRLILSLLWAELFGRVLRHARVARVALHPPDRGSAPGLSALSRALARLQRTHVPSTYAAAASRLWRP
jgi:uncharacterized protein